jgi:hypothetical protein
MGGSSMQRGWCSHCNQYLCCGACCCAGPAHGRRGCQPGCCAGAGGAGPVCLAQHARQSHHRCHRCAWGPAGGGPWQKRKKQVAGIGQMVDLARAGGADCGDHGGKRRHLPVGCCCRTAGFGSCSTGRAVDRVVCSQAVVPCPGACSSTAGCLFGMCYSAVCAHPVILWPYTHSFRSTIGCSMLAVAVH